MKALFEWAVQTGDQTQDIPLGLIDRDQEPIKCVATNPLS